MTLVDIEQELTAVFDRAGARGFIHARDIDSDDEVGLDADEPVVTASVFKVPVLLELAHAGPSLSPEQLAALQKRIESKGLLFKVRVVSAQMDGRETSAAPKGTSSL